MTTHEIDSSREGTTMTTQLCRRCRFHPASPRIAGYCSWDCYDADDEEEEGTRGRGRLPDVRRQAGTFTAPMASPPRRWTGPARRLHAAPGSVGPVRSP